jgi:hypothetical protein
MLEVEERVATNLLDRWTSGRRPAVSLDEPAAGSSLDLVLCSCARSSSAYLQRWVLVNCWQAQGLIGLGWAAPQAKI